MRQPFETETVEENGEEITIMKKWKRIVSLGMAAVLSLQCGEGIALAAEPLGQEKAKEVQTEEVQIGSEVWSTPMLPDAPEELSGVGQSEISLNETTGDGTWEYLFDIPDYTQPGGVPAPTEEEQDFDFGSWEDKNWQKIKVPGEPLMQGFDIQTNNEYYYKREITVPADFEGNRVLVRFDGVYCNARVWINGNYLKTHVGGFTTWDCDITDYAAPGETVTLVVGVADIYADTKGIWNPEGRFLNNPSNATEYAHHNIGGINRDVSLVALPYDCIGRTYVNTDFDETFTDASLEVTTQLGMVSDEAQLLLELLDGDTVVASAGAEFVPAGQSQELPEGMQISAAKKITIPVEQPKKWDAEHPNLYTLRSTLTVKGETVQVNEEKVGFREIHYDGRDVTDINKVYVNGKEVKLRGTCRHDVSDDLGRSMTREECYQEIRAYKKANINHIRTSHYPASEDLLDACDEMGMYVEQETAVCFQGYPNTTVSSRYEDYMPQFTEMVERDQNRPSILIWSLGNESNYTHVSQQSGGNPFWDEREYLKDVDATRPCIFSFPDTGEPYELADIYSKHYAYVSGSLGSWDRPTLHDEYAHISCYNLDELQRDVNVRNFWGESIKTAWENIFTTDGALGGDLWGGIDDVFYIPEGTSERWASHSDGQTAGYGEWGSVLDAYLREKPEAYLTKKAYSPIRIEEEACYLSNETLVVPVKNWFDHTNFNELLLQVTINDSVTETEIEESIEPHGEGELRIPGIPADAKTVNLKFYTPDGLMADEFEIEVAKITRSFTPASEKAPSIREEGNEILVEGEDFVITFDREKGQISNASCQGQTLLTGGPNLHVTGIELGEWILDSEQGIFAKTEGNYAVVTIQGSYENGQGVSFEIRISGNGILTTKYTLTTYPAATEGLSEVGISYDIPKDVDNVSWLRDGLYTVYPEDHIGRNEGSAKKVREGSDVTPDQYGVEPSWPWKDDMKNYFVYSTEDPDNGLVTNDFKTMRENVWYYNVNYSQEENAPHISVEDADAGVAARVEIAFDPGYVDDRDPSIVYTGSWSTYESESDYAGTETYSSSLGDACELQFYGTGVRYIGGRQNNTGRVKVFIDGELKEEIDTYSNLGNNMKQSVIYSVENLPEGDHTIRLETAGGNADCIVVDAFEVLNAKESSSEETAKLIINNQWFYPNLGWGNYTGNQGTLWQWLEDSSTIRLSSRTDFMEKTEPSLGGVEITEEKDHLLKAEYRLQNDDGNAQVELKWYRVAEGDPAGKATLLEETDTVLNTEGLEANKIYCTATLVQNGQEIHTVKSNEILIGEGSFTWYDAVDDSDLFVFDGIKGTDYQTDRNETWTQNAYEKTVTYLLDRENPASMSFTFTGKGIRWIGAKENNQGIAEVIVDDEPAVEVDLYDPNVGSGAQIGEVLFEKTFDRAGEHTITIRRTGRKSEGSWGNTVNVDAFLVIEGKTEQTEAPVFDSSFAVISSPKKKSAAFTLTNPIGEGTCQVYAQENGGEALSDPAVSVNGSSLVLTFAQEPAKAQAYYISAVEEGKRESERTAVSVIPYVSGHSILKAAIDSAKKLPEEVFTQESYAALEEALKTAQAAYEKEALTAEEAWEQTALLETAIGNLKSAGEEDYQELLDRLKEKEQELAACKEELKEVQEKVKNLETQLEEANERVRGLNTEISDLNGRITELEKDQTANQKEIENLKAQATALDTQLTAEKEETTRLLGELDEANEKAAGLETANRLLESQAEAARKEAEEARKAKEEAEEEQKKKEAELAACEEEAKKAREEAKKAVEQAKKEAQEAVEKIRKEAQEAIQKAKEETAAQVKKGTRVTEKGVVYRVTDPEGKKVQACSPADRNAKSIRILDQVTIEGQTYQVTGIVAKAFANMKKLRKVTVGKEVTAIGARAFYRAKNLKSIILQGKKLQSIGKAALKGISSKAVIKTPKGSKKAYAKMLKGKGQKKTVKIK